MSLAAPAAPAAAPAAAPSQPVASQGVMSCDAFASASAAQAHAVAAPVFGNAPTTPLRFDTTQVFTMTCTSAECGGLARQWCVPTPASSPYAVLFRAAAATAAAARSQGAGFVWEARPGARVALRSVLPALSATPYVAFRALPNPVTAQGGAGAFVSLPVMVSSAYVDAHGVNWLVQRAAGTTTDVTLVYADNTLCTTAVGPQTAAAIVAPFALRPVAAAQEGGTWVPQAPSPLQPPVTAGFAASVDAAATWRLELLPPTAPGAVRAVTAAGTRPPSPAAVAWTWALFGIVGLLLCAAVAVCIVLGVRAVRHRAVRR